MTHSSACFRACADSPFVIKQGFFDLGEIALAAYGTNYLPSVLLGRREYLSAPVPTTWPSSSAFLDDLIMFALGSLLVLRTWSILIEASTPLAADSF